jgi:hypothetical protein
MLLRRKVTRSLAALAILASVTIALPVHAAPPLPDGDIWVAGAEDARAAGPMAYGDKVAFGWTLDGKVAKNHYLTIRLTCTQGGDTVYKWFGQPDFEFPLHDQGGSQWTWDGGEAECTASLRYFANNRLSIVGSTMFPVAAGA